MAVHGSEPTIPCKTIIWNVCTLTTAFMAVQDSSQTDAALVGPLIIKSSLQHKVTESPYIDELFLHSQTKVTTSITC